MRTRPNSPKNGKVISINHQRFDVEPQHQPGSIEDLRARREEFVREEAVHIIKNLLSSFRLPKH